MSGEGGKGGRKPRLRVDFGLSDHFQPAWVQRTKEDLQGPKAQGGVGRKVYFH
jgi:hypothetical protein